jgi:hypothetical protein
VADTRRKKAKIARAYQLSCGIKRMYHHAALEAAKTASATSNSHHDPAS